MRLDRFDAQEQLGGDCTVAVAGGGQLADLPLPGGQRVRALEGRASWPQTGGDELATRPLGQPRIPGAIGIGERLAQRLPGLDAPPDPGERAAELEAQAYPLASRGAIRKLLERA